MSFNCPRCSEPSLEITVSKELGPDNTSDERSLQIIGCALCGFSGIALYEESRRGSFASEHVRHRGYAADPDTSADLEKLIRENRAVDLKRFLPPGNREEDYFDMILEQKK